MSHDLMLSTLYLDVQTQSQIVPSRRETPLFFCVFQDKWRGLVATGQTNIEMFDHVTLMTLDSLLQCAFSYNSNCQQ